jgi:molecular chaperone GrpE
MSEKEKNKQEQTNSEETPEIHKPEKGSRTHKKHPAQDALIAELQGKLEELNDKYIRLYSEFDNFRKRTLREKSELTKTASREVIYDLLPVLDDFDRALKHTENSDNLEALKEGEKLIFAKLKTILEQKGLQEIKSIGEPFDTDLHDAITNIPAPSDDMKGKIIDETLKGYLLNGKVIRYARVVVAS